MVHEDGGWEGGRREAGVLGDKNKSSSSRVEEKEAKESVCLSVLSFFTCSANKIG